MKDFINEYKIELAAVATIFVGVFLLIEPFHIRAFVYRTIMGLLAGVSGLFKAINEGMRFYFSRFTISDLLGWLLLIAAIVIIIWRTRQRYLVSNWYTSRICPRCGTGIRRAERKKIDRVLSKLSFIPFHRYFCPDKECAWVGLRKPGRYHRHKKSKDEDDEFRTLFSP